MWFTISERLSRCILKTEANSLKKVFLIWDSLTLINFFGFPKETPVYYSKDRGVPLSGFYVSRESYTYNGSKVVFIPLNIVGEIISFLEVKEDIREVSYRLF